MNIELRRLTYNTRLSQETNAYAADIYIDGKKVGDVRNDGGGGSSMVHITPRSLYDQAEAFCKAMPPEKSDDMELKMDLEFYLDMLAEKLIIEKETAAQYKRWIKKDVCFRLKTDKPGEYRTMALINGRYTKKHKDFIAAKYGDQVAEILNETLGVQPV